jgi:hypothetical protein
MLDNNAEESPAGWRLSLLTRLHRKKTGLRPGF